MKKQGKINPESSPEPTNDDLYLSFNDNNFKFLEWVDFGTMKLPMYYFLKDGKKTYYLHWCEKTTGGQRTFIADRSLTTRN